MSKARGSQKYRLTEAFITRVNAYRFGWPKRDDFVHWYREQQGYRGSVERNWIRLERGEGVPPDIARGFVEYLSQVRDWPDATLATACRAVVPAESRDEDGVWRGWRSVLGALTGRFRDRREMYPAGEEDCLAAARMVVICAGYKTAQPGEPLDEDACLARGERLMKLTVDDYARWLTALWRKERRVVTFAIVARKSGGKERCERVGVAVILPLSSEAARRFSAGEINGWDLGPDDLEVPAKYVFINAVGQRDLLQGYSVRERTRAEAHSALYQIAYLTNGIRPMRPTLLTIVTNPQYEQRLRRMGYRKLGVNIHGTDIPIVALRHPGEIRQPTGRDWYAYRFMMTMVEIYQKVNRGQWRREKGTPADGGE
jgi:hypothetical protein